MAWYAITVEVDAVTVDGGSDLRMVSSSSPSARGYRALLSRAVPLLIGDSHVGSGLGEPAAAVEVPPAAVPGGGDAGGRREAVEPGDPPAQTERGRLFAHILRTLNALWTRFGRARLRERRRLFVRPSV